MPDEPSSNDFLPRPVMDVISQAIKENKGPERLLYIFATIVILVGSAVLVYGSISGQTVTTISGAISSSLFVPAMSYAKRIRKDNMSIRLLEVSLNRADTAKEAADAIREAFLKNK